MDLFTTRELRMLVGEKGDPCISITMPTERTGPESEKDRILLKNLLGEARDKVKAMGRRRDELESLFRPIERLVEATFFWPCGCDGLAVFRSSDVFRRFRLPIRFEPMAVVSNRFHVRPLLPLLMASGTYYVLALSRGEVRLFCASRQSVAEIEIPEAPESLAETLRYDEPESQLQLHAGARGGRGKRSAVYHGQGVGTDDEESNTLRFLTEVNRGLHALLADETTPLVLAAADEIQGLYRRVNTYRHLEERGIVRNPEGMSPQELGERGGEIVRPLFERTLKDAADAYRTLAGRGSPEALADIRGIIPAASSGLVGTLFITNGRRLWGRHVNGGIVVTGPEPRNGDVDLLDLAIAETLLHNGRVHAVGPSEAPGAGPAAAILRAPAY